MNKIFLILTVLMTFSFVGCAPSTEMQPEQKFQSSTPPVIIESTKTEFPTSTPSSTSTITSTPTPSYCDYERAMKVIQKIDEWQGKTESGATKTPSPSGGSDLTDEQIASVIKAFEEKIDEIDKLDVPECLILSVGYLRTSYVKMMELFTPAKEGEKKDVFGLMAEISTAQSLFDEEYSRVKNCVESECK